MKKSVINPEWDGSWDGRRDLRMVLIGSHDEELCPSVQLPNVRLQDGDAMAGDVTFHGFPAGVVAHGLLIRKEHPDESAGSDGNKSALRNTEGWICKIYNGENGGFPFTGNGGDVIIVWNNRYIIHKYYISRRILSGQH